MCPKPSAKTWRKGHGNEQIVKLFMRFDRQVEKRNSVCVLAAFSQTKNLKIGFVGHLEVIWFNFCSSLKKFHNVVKNAAQLDTLEPPPLFTFL